MSLLKSVLKVNSVSKSASAPLAKARFFHKSNARFSSALSTHQYADDNNESTPFDFTDESMKEVDKILAKYPPGYHRGAMIPLLHLAQEQYGGWLPLSAMNKIAKMLSLPPIRVYEVASFYTMFNRTPVGKHHVQVCTTTPCMLRGAYDIVDTIKHHLKIDVGETTPDGLFTLGEVECAGACVNAPVMSVGFDYYEDLTDETTRKVLDAYKKGEHPKPGPQNTRKTCEGVLGKTSLIEPPTGPYAPNPNL